MLLNKNFIKNLKRYSGITPGAQHISIKDLKYFKNILLTKSPYRFFGKNKLSYCNVLENNFKKYLNRKFFLLVSSGTAALHLAIEALNIKEGDEVIIPAYGWSSDLMTIISKKAKPVIIPIDQYFGLNVDYLNRALSKKTKAIVAIHMRGHVCDIEKITKFAKKNKLKVIEDCSQCLGGKINGKRVGSFGDISTFSFQFNKLITAGEGGGVCTNDKSLFEKINRFHDLGMGRVYGQPDPVGRIAEDVGLNYHYNELSAGLLLAQFKKINTILKNLKINNKRTMKLFNNLKKANPHLSFEILGNRKNTEKNYAFFIISKMQRKNIDEIGKILTRNGINFSKISDRDGHNYNGWIKFMIKNNIPFVSLCSGETEEVLNKSFFIEINSLTKNNAKKPK
jgi:dTDP-4-amino-4,6-dideoxygalactose transaminase